MRVLRIHSSSNTGMTSRIICREISIRQVAGFAFLSGRTPCYPGRMLPRSPPGPPVSGEASTFSSSQPFPSRAFPIHHSQFMFRAVSVSQKVPLSHGYVSNDSGGQYTARDVTGDRRCLLTSRSAKVKNAWSCNFMSSYVLAPSFRL
jgi:hypothetical protein